MRNKTNRPHRIALFALPVLLLLIVIMLPMRSNTAAGEAPSPANAALKTEPSLPPDAAKISIGKPDANGKATVNGASGAVPGNVSVAIINLSSRNVITTKASANGAFSASLFAPPGSSLLVKYSRDAGLIDLLWQEALNPGGDFAYMTPLPGATIYVNDPPSASGGIPFNSAGFFGPGEGKVWAGWWMSGEVKGPKRNGRIQPQPGEKITVSGEIRMTSPAFNCATPISQTPHIHFNLVSGFGPDGQARLGRTWFNSYLFTPTGLPIEHEAEGERRGMGTAKITSLTCSGKNSAKGIFSLDFVVPADIPGGIYQIEGWINDGGLPLASGIRRVIVWYHFDPTPYLPLVFIGESQPPRIPWTLFANYTSNGHRGVQAVEDHGRYQMVTRVVLPPHRVVLPMIDSRSGEPIVYRLEPGSNWLSSNDRRFPNPPPIPLDLPGGKISVEIRKPSGKIVMVGPSVIKQSSVWTPSLPDGTILHEGTGHTGDIFHLYAEDEGFAQAFDQYGPHTLTYSGYVDDVYGNRYPIDATFEVMVARVLDLDPAQLPTTPYKQGDAFAPGLHIYPPVPADVVIRVTHMPFSNPAEAVEHEISGRANRFGIFQPAEGSEFAFETAGEFRVDISAEYEAPDGTLWAGYVTWGNVVEGEDPLIEAHGRRGMDYEGDTIDDMPAWFRNQDLPPEKMGIENYYPYFSGDIHWGEELAPEERRGDSIHSILTLRDLTGAAETIYDLIRSHHARATNYFRWPPTDHSPSGLEKRLKIGEAPLFITTSSGKDPTIYPEKIDMWGYWYGSSERPDVHVREIISEDGMGTAYWRFNDTYAYQIGEPADGDQPGDMKWEFGGVVFRVPGKHINEYAIYSSLWVLLPKGCDDYGCTRVTPPFQDATGASINGGPIMELLGKEIDMLFLPKGVRPGDILEVGNTVSFSGHVGPPLNSLVAVVITSPSGKEYGRELRANKIGWVYDPSFNFAADEPGQWTVDVLVEHDQPYIGNGAVPKSHNTGSVLGTSGKYNFYVVDPDSPRLVLHSPEPGFLTWPKGNIEAVKISGQAPPGTNSVHYTIHDKGIVMGQGTIKPNGAGRFNFSYDPVTLHQKFSMLSLVAHDGNREGLADEVVISFLATGGEPRANVVTLIGEEVFAHTSGMAANYEIYLPAVSRK